MANQTNSVVIRATLTRDPEVKYLDNEKASVVANLNLVNNYYDQKLKEQVPFYFKAAVWGKDAEYLASYASKGSAVIVTGSLIQPEAYINKDGEAVAVVVIKPTNVELLPRNKKDDDGEDDAPPAKTKAKAASGQKSNSTPDDYDDIPFASSAFGEDLVDHSIYRPSVGYQHERF